ncbi:MAG: hypothetical protein Q9211_002602 [Gyalolechia sp. 1 TL-2023]
MSNAEILHQPTPSAAPPTSAPAIGVTQATSSTTEAADNWTQQPQAVIGDPALFQFQQLNHGITLHFGPLLEGSDPGFNSFHPPIHRAGDFVAFNVHDLSPQWFFLSADPSPSPVVQPVWCVQSIQVNMVLFVR